MKFVFKIEPSGFCFWVQRAINLLYEIIEQFPNRNIYCVHQIVHNPKVVDWFKRKGVKFVDDVFTINDSNGVVVFSAHWVDKFILEKVKSKFFKVFNLECPLVKKIYDEVKNLVSQGRVIFYIWKRWHQEVKNVISYIEKLGGKVYTFLKEEEIPRLDKKIKIWVVSQTTLNFEYVNRLLEKIKSRFIDVKMQSSLDICKATYDRQTALRNSLSKLDCLIVIWGKNSSNTKELVNIWKEAWKDVYHIESYDEIEKIFDRLKKYNRIWVTWWASTPPEEIDKVVNFLKVNLTKEF